MTRPVSILPRDRVIELCLEGYSWDQIGRELGIGTAMAKTTYKIAELILAEGVVGILATPLSREPREAACLPLGAVLEDLSENNPNSKVYNPLLRMLNCGALDFDWVSCEGDPIRLWRSNGDIELLQVLDKTDQENSPAIKGLTELEKLEQFVMGNFVFTVDLWDPIQFGGRL